jgi:hypothetical protein
MLALIGMANLAKGSAISGKSRQLSGLLRRAEGLAETTAVTAVIVGAAAIEVKSILRK